MNLENISDNEIVDISTIKINKRDKKEDKIISYIKQVKNPYLYKYKDFTIRIHYSSENLLTLEELLKNYIKNL